VSGRILLLILVVVVDYSTVLQNLDA